MADRLSPEMLLQAYAAGIFPMAAGRDDPTIHWFDPPARGVFPLPGFHISRSLRRAILRADYRADFDRDFGAVLRACAAREETWINGEIHDLYMKLHRMGRAHSQEIWRGDVLVGGVYGVVLRGAFFGESMFSRRTNASKIALAWLIDRLRLTGFSLFDTQFLTPHLASLGAIEISRAAYHAQLLAALARNADITRLNRAQTAQDVIQRNTQTS
jgi:leucyl/phenylalanyl-tRNA---protein transferase